MDWTTGNRGYIPGREKGFISSPKTHETVLENSFVFSGCLGSNPVGKEDGT
jgi:hypothetical protein